MAVELEQTVMNEIGLGANYRWFNGSGSCEYIRRQAVEKLSAAAAKHGLTISVKWLNQCRTANRVDQVDGGQYSLTNTWVACSYAIQDAIYRSQGGPEAGYDPPADYQWQFWSDEKRQEWERRNNSERGKANG